MQLVQVDFRGDTIEVVDNGVSVNAICRNLGIDANYQRQKIQCDESFESKFSDIEINCISQRVLCIPLSKLNGWLFSINPNKVKPEVRQKLIDYKNECFDVLYRHFNPKADTNQLERENIELKRALNRLLKQPTPTCEELLKLHYPILHNNILELDNNFKNIDTAALQRFVFLIAQIQKNINTLAQGLKQDRKKRS